MLQVCRRMAWAGMLLGTILAALSAGATSPATTTVSDTVYRGDGMPAAGTLLISWPAFTAASGEPVAAGSMSVALGGGGALSVALVPTAGATPSGTLYSFTSAVTPDLKPA